MRKELIPVLFGNTGNRSGTSPVLAVPTNIQATVVEE